MKEKSLRVFLLLALVLSILILLPCCGVERGEAVPSDPDTEENSDLPQNYEILPDAVRGETRVFLSQNAAYFLDATASMKTLTLPSGRKSQIPSEKPLPFGGDFFLLDPSLTKAVGQEVFLFAFQTGEESQRLEYWNTATDQRTLIWEGRIGQIHSLILKGDRIYFSATQRYEKEPLTWSNGYTSVGVGEVLCSVKTDGSSFCRLENRNGEYHRLLAVSDEAVYFTKDTNTVCSVDLLLGTDSIKEIHKTEGYLQILRPCNDGFVALRTSTDGSERIDGSLPQTLCFIDGEGQEVDLQSGITGGCGGREILFCRARGETGDSEVICYLPEENRVVFHKTDPNRLYDVLASSSQGILFQKKVEDTREWIWVIASSGEEISLGKATTGTEP